MMTATTPKEIPSFAVLKRRRRKHLKMSLNIIFLQIALNDHNTTQVTVALCIITALRDSVPDGLSHCPVHKPHGNCIATATKNKHAIIIGIDGIDGIIHHLLLRGGKSSSKLPPCSSTEKDH